MIIGHYAVALIAKKWTPKISLGTLFAASQFADILCILFLFLGVEKVAPSAEIKGILPLHFIYYPVSHSLVTSLLWSALLAICFIRIKPSPRSAVIVFLVSASHWFLDVLVHRRDVPLTLTGDIAVGFGLWNSPLAWFMAEGLFFLFAAGFYMRRMPNAGKRPFKLFLLSAAIVHGVIFSLHSLPQMSMALLGFVALLHLGFIVLGFLADRT